MEKNHISVLAEEVIAYLAPQKGETVLDATVGLGGHATNIALHLGTKGTLVGIDEDMSALRIAEDRVIGCRAIFIQGNFRNMDKLLSEVNIEIAHKILFDFGMSSFALDNPERGFSFSFSGPLKMTMSGENAITTADTVINEWSEGSLADIIFGFGEERYARKIAKAIVLARKIKRIEKTDELAEIIAKAIPRRGKTHPATKTFQAIRIAVNDELGAITEAFPKAWSLLPPGGRIVAISFHSLEDRIVKRFFHEKEKEGGGKVLTKKPIRAGAQEISENPRSRSGRLRAIEKL